MKTEAFKRAALYVAAVLLWQGMDRGIDWAIPIVLELARPEPATEAAPSAATASERLPTKCPMLGADSEGLVQAWVKESR